VLADYAKFLQHQLKQPESASVQEPAGDAQEQGATRMVCLRVDGADRWLEHRARYRKSPGSGALVETGYWADVSELKLREVQITGAKQTLEATNAKLLETVDELERTRGALVQSEKLASLGAMVAGVSHELNTPLGNALLASSGLKQSLVDTQQGLLKGELKKSKLERSLDESVAASELIERSVQRASELVARFKQTASDQTAQERVRFDLDRLLQHVVAEAKGRFADATWTIVLNSEPGMELDSFPKPLEQVLQCLIDNCIAHGFTGRTHGTIAISAVPSGPNDRVRESVEIVVQDNGCGIPPEIATRVFDPFFTTKMGRHVGIGLNVAYRMVTTLLGGTIAVDTGFSGGGRIVLHLPMQAPATI
jgi:signal transduction histidine kinase